MRVSFTNLVLMAVGLMAGRVQAQNGATALTIYNQDFAVARTTIDLNLKAGSSDVLTTQVTRSLEPDSVILRDPAGRNLFRITEQNYDASVIDQASLLRKFEGQTIEFQTPPTGPGQAPTLIKGRIIRAGDYGTQPLIEVDGRMQFQLPGTPLFPASTDGLLLKPTLKWKIEAARPERFGAELAYITRGFNWQATYNIVVPESTDVTGGDKADLTGWVTMQNLSGTDFPEARIKLMAGDLAKIQPVRGLPQELRGAYAMSAAAISVAPNVTQQAFDDFHLYDLNRTVSLLDGETKQVEFLSAKDVTIKRLYQFDGAARDLNVNWNSNTYTNTQDSFGLSDNTSVSIQQEIKNSDANHLGMPLPAGRMRLYRRDTGGQMEFVGESMIKHTPADDTVSIVTGNAFDVKGKRTQTKFYVQTPNGNRFIDENFSIKLTNAKKQPVTVVVVEHLYRGRNWVIRDSSVPYKDTDAHTIEFPVEVPASGETTVTYSVHYTW